VQQEGSEEQAFTVDRLFSMLVSKLNHVSATHSCTTVFEQDFGDTGGTDTDNDLDASYATYGSYASASNAYDSNKYAYAGAGPTAMHGKKAALAEGRKTFEGLRDSFSYFDVVYR
jgi:hypothetical protein